MYVWVFGGRQNNLRQDQWNKLMTTMASLNNDDKSLITDRKLVGLRNYSYVIFRTRAFEARLNEYDKLKQYSFSLPTFLIVMNIISMLFSTLP